MHPIAAICQHHQKTIRSRLSREEEKKLKRAFIAPMEIFDHQQERVCIYLFR